MDGHREPHYRVLGPLSVSTADGTPVGLRGDLQRRLVAALLLHTNHPLATDVVADLLWGDSLPDDVAGAVQTHVSRLRRVLPAGALVTRPGGYCLDISDDDLDSDRFDRQVTEAVRLSRAEPERAVEILDLALGLWRGVPYAEFADWDAARNEASRLEELRLLANEERAEALLASGRHEEAVTDLVPLAREHPLRDRSRSLLMTAFYRAGRQSEALQAYEDHRRRLADELGLDPSPALRALERAILEHTLDTAQHIGVASAAESPPRTLPAADAPHPVTRLIGRDGNVRDLLELLRTERALTVTGPGGVGKTRVALEVAHAVEGEFERVVFCELAPLGRADDVVRAVASRLGVESLSDVPLADRLVEAVYDRKLLLVLDNCEHVIDAAAALVQRLVEGTSSVAVLATSRERLAVGGERMYVVEPLDDADAIELFVERSRAVRPGFELAEPDAADLLFICQRLDGLPLAIELAAARSQALSVREIADAISQRFQLLTGGSRTAGRQRSLLEAVRWSFDLLDGTERELCEQLAVFAGGITVESAAAVSGLDPVAAADALARLTERSLLSTTADPSGTTRFQMLETMRQYGTDRLTERGALGDTRQAHATHFVSYAERWRAAMNEPLRSWQAIFVIEADLANLRAANAWLVGRADAAALAALHAALFDYGMQAVRPEIFTWADAAIGVVATDEPARAQILQSVAYGRWQRGDVDGAWSAVREARALAEPGSAAAYGVLAQQGNLEGRAGNLESAIALVTEAAAL
ncbi:MAG: BTAD domain-containing putative transcriptional regulator, partial [Ilumatobacteraceae bacterium]